MDKYMTKTLEELKKLAAEKKEELHKVSTDVLSGKEKNVKAPGMIRKEIARILTAISLKEKTE